MPKRVSVRIRRRPDPFALSISSIGSSAVETFNPLGGAPGERYMAFAIAKRTSSDFAEAVKTILPGLVAAVGLLLTTTAVGSLLGAAAAGIGAVPGAAAGFSAGSAILEWFGLGFLAVYIVANLGAVEDHFSRAIRLAWNACGSESSIDDGAHAFAEGVAVLISLILQAIIASVAKEGLEPTLQRLSQSKYGMVFAAWLERGKWTDDPQFWLDSLGKPMEPPLVRQRLRTALGFLRDRRFGTHDPPLRFSELGAKGPLTDLKTGTWKVDAKISYLRGIDFNRPVEVITLVPGSELVQFRETPGGNFFTEAGTSPARLGIDATGKQYIRYQVTKPTAVLKTTVAEFRDVRTGEQFSGRGTQYMIDDVAVRNNLKVK